MNWRSPLELGIRLINWVWALELIRPSGAISSELAGRILQSAYRHLWDISRQYSKFSSVSRLSVKTGIGQPFCVAWATS